MGCIIQSNMSRKSFNVVILRTMLINQSNVIPVLLNTNNAKFFKKDALKS